MGKTVTFATSERTYGLYLFQTNCQKSFSNTDPWYGIACIVQLNGQNPQGNAKKMRLPQVGIH